MTAIGITAAGCGSTSKRGSSLDFAAQPRISVAAVEDALAETKLPQIAVRNGAWDQPGTVPESWRTVEKAQVSGFCENTKLFMVYVYSTPQAAKQGLARVPSAQETGRWHHAFVHENLLVFDTCRPGNRTAEHAIKQL